MLVSKRAHLLVSQNERIWKHLFSESAPRPDELGKDEGYFEPDVEVRNGRVTEDGFVREESPLSLAELRALVKGSAWADRLSAVLDASVFLRNEGWTFRRLGYFSPKEVVVLGQTMSAAFAASNPDGVATGNASFTDDQTVSDFISDLRGENDDEEEEEEKAKDANGKNVTKEEALKELAHDLIAFPLRVRYATGDGPNCDNLVDALYVSIDGIAVAGVLLFRAW